MEKFDVVIIGGGIGGLMSAYRLAETTALKVLLLEKGLPIEERICPLIRNKTEKCMMCRMCSVMSGMAGAGAFSDGKYVIGTEYGGWLTDFIPKEKVMELIEEADSVLMRFGATDQRYLPDDELKLKCLKYDLHMQQAVLKHLGTDDNFRTMQRLIQYLSERTEIRTSADVTDVDKGSRRVRYNYQGEEREIQAQAVLFAVGRAGSRWFAAWCAKNGVKMTSNQVDIGVRVELPRIIWKEFAQKIYEPKIVARSKGYGDYTRMFCFNDGGEVVTENTDGVLTVNGHSYRDPALKTENSNFALLTTTRFTEPFNEPIEYARYVASLANKISGGGVLMQRFGDLTQGRRTNEHRMKHCNVRPTLNAVAGDLSLCMPKRQLDNIIEAIYALDNVAPGTANYDTLLYGVECKYYSSRPDCEDFRLRDCPGIYAAGDGAGFTRSLSQAAANGLYAAEKIARDLSSGK